MEYKVLTNGFKIPMVGIGTNTFGKVNHDYMGDINMDTKELLNAYDNGYRLIDTAISYRNEKVIMKSILDSSLKRSDVLVTSKIPLKGLTDPVDEQIENHIQSSLDIFGGYVDVYLIHHPLDDALNLKVWQVLEKHYKLGRFKAIGVSNFNEAQLNYLMQHSEIKPMLNQIESNPDNWQNDLIDFCLKHEIAPVAWSPLKRVSKKEVFESIGKKYDKSWAQVLLKYQVMRGVVVIPKSHDKTRQFDNINIFDFTLSKEDLTKIKENS